MKSALLFPERNIFNGVIVNEADQLLTTGSAY